jgi:hypothetical protein
VRGVCDVGVYIVHEQMLQLYLLRGVKKKIMPIAIVYDEAEKSEQLENKIDSLVNK